MGVDRHRCTNEKIIRSSGSAELDVAVLVQMFMSFDRDRPTLRDCHIYGMTDTLVSRQVGFSIRPHIKFGHKHINATLSANIHIVCDGEESSNEFDNGRGD